MNASKKQRDELLDFICDMAVEENTATKVRTGTCNTVCV